MAYAPPAAGPPARRRGRWIQWIVDAVLVVLAAFILLAGYVYWRARRTEPRRDGRISLPGLTAPVLILRDGYGVAHIQAQNLHDLYLAEGFAMAQDRLWQMDFLRRLAEGTLSAGLGPKALPVDKQTLRLGLPRIAASEARHLDPLDRTLLDAFSRGVNLYIRGHQGRLPLEFALLHYRPAPWRPQDSLAIAAQMYRTLAMTYPDELEREAFAQKLSPAALAMLFPSRSPWDLPPARQSAPSPAALPVLAQSRPFPRGGPGPRPASARALPALWPFGRDQDRVARSGSMPGGAAPADVDIRERAGQSENPPIAGLVSPLSAWLEAPASVANTGAGSNNWVLGPARVTTGMPVLANDPHLEYQVPGLFWAVELSLPDWRAAGAAIAGAPGIIIGHNQHIAWGMTNTGADVQDLYRERIRNGQVWTVHGWRPLQVLTYHLAVKGRPAVTYRVELTPRGPIVGRDPVTHQPLALDWSLYYPGSLRGEFGVFLHLSEAANWRQFEAALAAFPGPAQNFIYADTAGNIGYQCAARIPIRRTGQGLFPAPGADPRYGWKGWIPFAQLPHVFDPANQILVTANGRVTPRGYPYRISNHWYGPFRTLRIYRLLGSRPRWQPAGMSAVQMDTISIPARFFARQLVQAGRRDPAAVTPSVAQALGRLRRFDGNMRRNRVAPTLVALTRKAFLRQVIAARVGPGLARHYRWNSDAVVIRELLTERPAAWLPPAYRAQGWDAFLLACLRQVVGHSDLTAPRWHWGQHSRLFVPHLIYSHVPLLSAYADLGPVAANGGKDTIDRTTGLVGPCLRFVADLADWDRSTLTLFA
ncbi:MAG: penicillin acylase family protein, partial [Terriglobales bacterium]